MVDRKDVASWLEGPHASREPAAGSYPGARLGMPRDGAGSAGRFGRRAAALLVDWLLCQLIAMGLFGYRWGDGGAGGFLPLAVFLAENVLLVGTVGYTVGHRVFGLRVVRVVRAGDAAPAAASSAPLGPLGALIRSLLLCLAIPALIWDRDERGLHDLAAGSVIVRR
ncbi:MAG TPA: RDD family protein [Dermatophilaceae bacterium]|nr:RDD family protein [Dermatophilaceae bacterium]